LNLNLQIEGKLVVPYRKVFNEEQAAVGRLGKGSSIEPDPNGNEESRINIEQE